MAAITKDYVIPLRRVFQASAPHKKTPKALRGVKEYILKHSKVEEVKLGAALNDFIWKNGIRNPPPRVSVTAIILDGVAKVELQGVAYKEAPKVEKKAEPETLKEKIEEKIGVKKSEEPKAEEKAPVKEEAPKKEAEPTKEEKPAAEESTDKKE